MPGALQRELSYVNTVCVRAEGHFLGLLVAAGSSQAEITRHGLQCIPLGSVRSWFVPAKPSWGRKGLKHS